MEEKKGFKDVACKPNITIFEWLGIKGIKLKDRLMILLAGLLKFMMISVTDSLSAKILRCFAFVLFFLP